MPSSVRRGIQGVISVFLSIVLLPFFSIAAVLVETSRYTAAVQELEATMDSASLSTLGTYDRYLHQRFGLLAVAQQAPVETIYQGYFQRSLSSSLLSTPAVSVSGLSPLSDTNVLYRQALEAGKLSVPAKFLLESLDVEELIGKLEELTKLTGILEGITSAGSTVEGLADLGSHLESLEATLTTLKEQKSAYEARYLDWWDAVDALAAEMGEEEPELGNLPQEEAQARQDYLEAAAVLDSQLGSYRQLIQQINRDLTSITNAAVGTASSFGQAAADHASDQASTDYLKASYDQVSTAIDAATSSSDQIVDSVEAILQRTSDAEILAMRRALSSLQDTVDAYTVTASSSLPTYYDGVYYVEVTFLNPDDIWNLLNRQNNQLQNSEGLWTALDAIGAFFGTMAKIQLLYDGSCCAVVSEPMDPGTNLTYQMITDITTILESLALAAGIITWPIFMAKLADLWAAITDLFASLFAYIAQIVDNILNLSYEGLLFNLYLMYNLPNRTNYTSGKGLTGYAFHDRAIPPALGSGTPTSGALSAITSLAHTFSADGSDSTFVGAEFEYILEGRASEIGNQVLAFVDLYFLRMLLDVVPIFCNQEVQWMANLANLLGVGWLVYLLEILCEPLVDTLLLVNGEKVSIWLSPIYLTPSGIPKLIDKVVNFELTPDQQSQAEDTVHKLTNIPHLSGVSPGSTNPFVDYAKGLIELSYEEHLMLVLTVTGNREHSLRRFQNLITMDAQTQYALDNPGMTFDLGQSYTALEATASGTVPQLLPIPALSSRSLFSMERTLYRGY